MTYNDAKNLIISLLKKDAEYQTSGNIEPIGAHFDDYDGVYPRDYRQLNIAWSFWDSWIDEKNHGFPGFYKGISKDVWPHLALEIADTLEREDDVYNELVLTHFDFSRRR